MVLYVLQTILKPIGGNIMNALNTIKDLIVQLTGVACCGSGPRGCFSYSLTR